MPNPERLNLNLDLIATAARAGERAPMIRPRGPIDPYAVTDLYEAGIVRSEVYQGGFRRIVILQGKHAGLATASHPKGFPPYMINGKYIRGVRSRSGERW